MPSWKTGRTGWRTFCAASGSSASTTTRSSWRTTRATSNAARRASGPVSSTPPSIRFSRADELAYIVNNSESKVLIFSEEKRTIATEALKQCPNVEVALIADGPGDEPSILNLDEAT